MKRSVRILAALLTAVMLLPACAQDPDDPQDTDDTTAADTQTAAPSAGAVSTIDRAPTAEELGGKQLPSSPPRGTAFPPCSTWGRATLFTSPATAGRWS